MLTENLVSLQNMTLWKKNRFCCLNIVALNCGQSYCLKFKLNTILDGPLLMHKSIMHKNHRWFCQVSWWPLDKSITKSFKASYRWICWTMSYTTCFLLNNPPVSLSHLLVCDYRWDFPFIHPESLSAQQSAPFFTCPWFLPATTICSPFAATYSKKKKKKSPESHASPSPHSSFLCL